MTTLQVKLSALGLTLLSLLVAGHIPTHLLTLWVCHQVKHIWTTSIEQKFYSLIYTWRTPEFQR